MKLQIIAGLAVLALANPAFAAGDIKKGEKTFRKCKACHSIVAPDGTKIVRGGKIGPNLYGVIGRPAASEKSFDRYGDGIKAAAAKGLVWTEEEVAKYVMNPTAFLDEYTGDKSLRSKMSYRQSKPGNDVAAYLASVVPEAK